MQMKNFFRRPDEKGASLVEYATIIGLIGTVSVVVVLGLGERIDGVFSDSAGTVSDYVDGSVTGNGSGSGSGGGEMTLVFNASNSQVTLPLYGAVNATIDWGGANSGCATTVSTIGNVTCSYTSPGTYTVKISGLVDQFGNGGVPTPDIDNLVSVTSFGSVGLTSLSGAFLGADNLTSLPNSLPAGVSDLSYTFAFSGFAGNISGWDTSAVTTMESTFSQAPNFNSNISGWNVGNVSTFRKAFDGAAAFNQPIGTWNTGSATNMSDMFFDASSFNKDLSGWDTADVTAMNGMFKNASSFNGDVTTWDVSSVDSFHYMFSDASSFNQDIDGWNVSTGLTFEAMFQDALAFNQDLNSWDVSTASDMDLMFKGASAFNGDVSNWDVSGVKDMESVFTDAIAFNQDISGWNTSSAQNMNYMFLSASSFNQDLSGWCVSSLWNGASPAPLFSQGSPIDGTAWVPVWGTCPP